jgi:hypothetical protein
MQSPPLPGQGGGSNCPGRQGQGPRGHGAGKRIWWPKGNECDGFAERFGAMASRIGPDGLSRRQASEELSIGCVVLKRRLDA